VNQVTEAAEIVAQEAKTFERTGASHSARLPEDRITTHEALRTLTDASARLARALDALATEYDAPGLGDPSTVHVALDQAAAAAEDLGACTKLAARAIESEY
jgi:hypothetical protein